MMDQRELESTIRQLQKTVAANEAASNVVAILERLKKEASPTEDMLRSTRAGVYVGKLRQNSNRDIARLANELVIKWKRLVESEKSARMQKLKQSSPATPSPKPSTTSLPAKAEAASPQKADEPFKGNPETRKHSTDGISTSRTGDAVRDSCLGLIYNGLAYKSTLSADSILKRAVQVEEAAFKSLGGTNDAYKKKCRTLFHNLKNNRDLSATILDGSLASQRLVEMSTEELKSAEQRKKEDALQIENMKKAQVPMAEKSISDALKCGKCQQKKVSYTQAQTRSADEPMTTFCECTVCGNRWKFS